MFMTVILFFSETPAILSAIFLRIKICVAISIRNVP